MSASGKGDTSPEKNSSSGKARHWVGEEEIQLLRAKLQEAQETLEAIQSGAVDAVVINSEAGSQIYTLSGAEEPYRVYVERMQEGAVTVSQTGLILYSNQKFSEFLDITLERVIGSDASTHLGDEIWQTISRGVSSGVVKIETSIRRLSQPPLPVMVTASLLEMSDQSVVCLVVTDLSEQKEKAELSIAKEVAESANNSKDSFIAVLSHELRTPLTPALMAACLLEADTSLSEKARSLATMIRRNVELETRLIDDLLDLTRIAQGKIELHPKRVDLHSVLREAASVCQPDLDDRDQILEFSLDADRSHLLGDPVRLQQIFWNLIRNASKFSGRGQPIYISSRNISERQIEITIRDNGAGIDPDIIAKLFAPFEQGGEQITRSYGGLGLGLAICKSIAEMHPGGSIQVKSDGKGKGSAFALILETLPSQILPADEESASSLGTVLLVEDNADTRLTLSLLLESLGYRVHEACSVETGLELSGQHRFDILLSDIGLPDGTGHDLMRALSQRAGLRGIAMSGYGMPEDVQRSLDAGFEEHLTKPLSSKILRASIARVCER